jgi:hypothetical protein
VTAVVAWLYELDGGLARPHCRRHHFDIVDARVVKVVFECRTRRRIRLEGDDLGLGERTLPEEGGKKIGK